MYWATIARYGKGNAELRSSLQHRLSPQADVTAVPNPVLPWPHCHWLPPSQGKAKTWMPVWTGVLLPAALPPDREHRRHGRADVALLWGRKMDPSVTWKSLIELLTILQLGDRQLGVVTHRLTALSLQILHWACPAAHGNEPFWIKREVANSISTAQSYSEESFCSTQSFKNVVLIFSVPFPHLENVSS